MLQGIFSEKLLFLLEKIEQNCELIVGGRLGLKKGSLLSLPSSKGRAVLVSNVERNSAHNRLKYGWRILSVTFHSNRFLNGKRSDQNIPCFYSICVVLTVKQIERERERKMCACSHRSWRCKQGEWRPRNCIANDTKKWIMEQQ